MSIKENLEIINNRIIKACDKTGRKSDSVKLMAVSKFHPAESVIEAIEAGQMLFGENRVQEACDKFPALMEKYPEIKLHMIGSLQSNKVKNAISVAECIQSVDRISLLDTLEKQCVLANKNIKVLFEIHTGEESKSGFENKSAVAEALDLCAEGKYSHIIPAGFMTMAPFTDDEKLVRKSFITLRKMSEDLQGKYKQFNLTELSMGMSGDFEIAIEEGSTLVRVGTAIFGERVY